MSSEPFDRFDAEAARLDAFYAALPGPEWAAETRCAGWDRKDILAHLCGVEDYARAGLDDTVARYAERDGEKVGYERLNEVVVAELSPLSRTDLLDLWRGKVAEVHSALRERGKDGDAVIATGAGAYPLARQTWFFANEFAVHADDAGVPVGAAERAEREEWRARFVRDALAEYASSVTVTPLADDRFALRLDAETAEVSAAELVDAAARRLPAGRLPERLSAAVVVLA